MLSQILMSLSSIWHIPVLNQYRCLLNVKSTTMSYIIAEFPESNTHSSFTGRNSLQLHGTTTEQIRSETLLLPGSASRLSNYTVLR